jgi:hypothetical protein
MRKTGSVTKRKKYQPQPDEYIVVADNGQVWTGIRGEELAFSDDWDEAKPLTNDIQFGHLERMTYFKLEKLFL